MLQRIQTLFLLGVAVSISLLLIFKIWVKVDPETGEYAELTAYQLTYTKEDVKQVVPAFYIAVLALSSAVLAFISMFKYTNRLTQIKLNLLNTLLITSTLGVMVYFALAKGEHLFGENIQGAFQMGFYIPVAALFFNSLANRYIKKDEDMVRSADRLR